ncbi:3-hydroxyacyl-ACP dehydratase FabZ family protein [Galbibacter mesophilus]|uniref:3-hydroxyacyl-ACP dehydratase FabZ family protein n=1 Tax=Galbibacter mesophilus TaxID=379069 RepID=UPI0019200DA2|nr:3-hydroxyacyl-ACP dehydratase FabZ family protein [Galbibacter mesophilus]MCM5663269.1 beta-hydroxyacyl-ACP dehydratase [Galbibacter mesophilus]
MNTTEKILQNLPYEEPFLFVDGLQEVSEERVEGFYTFKSDSYFYKGHFKGNPVTPGVILTECCAQIGLVCMGLYTFTLSDTLINKNQIGIGLSSSEMEFYTPVYPDEKVRVVSEKIYYRFHKLKCNVKMYNSKNELVCKGTIAGMIKSLDDGR